MRPRIFAPTFLTACLLMLGAIAASAQTAPASSAPCGGDFGAWLQGVRQEAAAQGISQRAISAGLDGISYDPSVIARDHAQGVFRQSFEQFSGRMIPPRLARAQKLLAQNAPTFSRIEQQFGVPGAVITAIWGLETDFGADNGKFPTIRSLASLAYDCRRPDKFRGEVFAAHFTFQVGRPTNILACPSGQSCRSGKLFAFTVARLCDNSLH